MSTPYFLVDQTEITKRISAIDPEAYIRNRNYLDGNVTRLSPFITHGIITVRDLAKQVLENHSPKQVEKFLFQLAWREFFHRVWETRGSEIFDDLRQPQPHGANEAMPQAVLEGATGIAVLDAAVRQLVDEGWIHNHARMWIAAVVCNIGKSRWQPGARWMHYHLLDGDLASNTLSWQWVAGTFSNKTYIANQDNLNKFSRSDQRDTFLDSDYPQLAEADVPQILQATSSPTLDNAFPDTTLAQPLADGETVLLYHPFNLDPRWRANTPGRRVLLIEPERYRAWPLSPARWQFIKHWAEQIEGLQIYTGTLSDCMAGANDLTIISREYPLYSDWPGQRDPRDWLFPEVSGYFPSFYKFWNKARKTLV